MFQFGRFPTYTYVFSIRFTVLHRECFHIRISADRSSFAAPRSFSQLVTSFFGSWCQGIHLMLLFTWTFFASSHHVSWIAWVSEHFLFRFVNSFVKRFYPFALESFSTFRWNCNLPKLERPINSTLWSRKNYLSSYLFVSYSSIYFIRFSMITSLLQKHPFRFFTIGWGLGLGCILSKLRRGAFPAGGLKLESLSNVPRSYMRSIEALRFDPVANCVRVVGSSGLEPPTSRLSGARSNHLSYEPI